MTSPKPTLHLICGKAASGKTTLARTLAERERAIFFCEDEWLAAVSDGNIKSVKEYAEYNKRCRRIIAPLAQRLLRLGVSVIFDFAGNRPQDRSWVRSIFEAAGADHVLHYLVASDAACKARLRQRNETRPEGVYFGHVSEELFDEVTQYFVPPSNDEGFHIVRYEVG